MLNLKKITVDFNNRSASQFEPAGKVSVGLDIFADSQSAGVVFTNFFSKKRALVHLKIVESVNSELKLRDPDQPIISFDWASNKTTIIEGLPIGKYGVQIPLVVHTALIEDYLGSGDTTQLQFKIQYQDHPANDEKTLSNETLHFEFIPEIPSGAVVEEVKFLKTEVEQETREIRKQIAQLIIKNPAKRYCSQPVKGFVSIKTHDDFDQNLLTFDNDKTLIEINPLQNKEEQRIPVFINMDQHFPENTEQTQLLTWHIQILDTQQKPLLDRMSKNYQIKIKQKSVKKITNIEFAVLYGDDIFEEITGSEYIQTLQLCMEKPVLWTPVSPQQKRSIELFKLRIGNSAITDNPPGKITIRHLSISLAAKESRRLTLARKGISLNDLLKYTEFEGVEIHNGDSSHEIIVKLVLQKIGQDSDNLVPMTAAIQLSYDIEQPDEDNIRDNCQLSLFIDFTLQKRISHWLAIDFGTSAITAAFADDTFNPAHSESSILNIREAHLKRLMEKTGTRFEQYLIPEENTPYLPSELLLDVISSDNGVHKLTDHIIKLAPLANDPGYGKLESILPPLKLLIGYENIPTFENYFYYKNSQQKVTVAPLPVDLVLSRAYQDLLKETIIPLVNQKLSTHAQKQLNRYALLKSLGKIVLTVPNTFGETQEKVLLNMLEQEITWEKLNLFNENSPSRQGPIFAKESILFIRESDAVACYYYDNWLQLNHGAITEPKLMELPLEEYLLVFDVGAGTLDITYLMIRRDEETRLLGIEVLGRIGSKRAGNVLDTFLAKALLKAAIEKKVANCKDQIVFSDDIKRGVEKRNSLKQFIKLLKVDIGRYWGKNTKKTIADTWDQFTEKHTPDLGFDKDFIRTLPYTIFENDTFIQQYVRFTSQDVLEQFVANLGSRKNHREFLVDTIIFSGRGSQFPEIRKQSIKFIKEKRTNINQLNIVTLREDELKNAVVLGALAYAIRFSEDSQKFKDKFISAHYGILYRVGNRTHFCKLLGPDDSIDMQQANDGIVYRSKTEYLDFSQEPLIRLVQTYHTKPDLDDDQMTSMIIQIPVDAAAGEGYPRNHLSVQLIIHKNKRLSLIAGRYTTEPENIERISLEWDIVMEESSWPNCYPRKIRREICKDSP
ncbi:MAG: hypothetical protein KDH98_14740 [Calditrichaeota bacterium]|nr:hypothetical protein [Calditrichota bacterium]